MRKAKEREAEKVRARKREEAGRVGSTRAKGFAGYSRSTDSRSVMICARLDFRQ